MSKTIKVRANSKHLKAIQENAYPIIIEPNRGQRRIGTVKDIIEGCIYLNTGIVYDTLRYYGDGVYSLWLIWGNIRFKSIKVEEWDKQLEAQEER